MSGTGSTSGTIALDWEARFAAGTTPWERGAVHPALAAWLAAGTLSPGRILVPGAGRGAEPLALARAGFAVSVVDVAPRSVAFQREALAGTAAEVVEADLFAYAPAAPFDAIYDQTCLCALPPATWSRYAARLAGWLRPGGVLAVLFMQSGKHDGPPFHCAEPAMRALFAAPAWAWPDTPAPPIPHPAGFTELPVLLRRI